jgi:hypothetical protein
VCLSGVAECSDGSVIFDFGEAAQRPDQDPLADFVRGGASALESQAETSEAAAPLLEQDSQVADERPGELVGSDESSRYGWNASWHCIAASRENCISGSWL